MLRRVKRKDQLKDKHSILFIILLDFPPLLLPPPLPLPPPEDGGTFGGIGGDPPVDVFEELFAITTGVEAGTEDDPCG